jgi:hypothetical protein
MKEHNAQIYRVFQLKPAHLHDARWPVLSETCCILTFNYLCVCFYGGHTVAQLVVALRYKPEVRGFDSGWCHWNFSLT